MADGSVCITGAASTACSRGLNAQALATLTALHRAGHRRLSVLAGDGNIEDWKQDGPSGPEDCGHQRIARRKQTSRSFSFARPGSHLQTSRRVDPDLAAVHAIVDVSSPLGLSDGEDSKAFRESTGPLLLAIREHKPLFLSPRRVGPFPDSTVRETVREILHHARMVWAWDTDSFECMQSLLGARFDSTRHQLGADPAFALWSAPLRLDAERLPWFTGQADRDRPPLVGFEVCSHTERGHGSAHRSNSSDARYAPMLAEVVDEMLRETNANILLIPAPTGNRRAEQACRKLLKRARPQGTARRRTRIAILPDALEPLERRWLHGCLDWFCGTNAEAMTSALSAGTPAVGLIKEPSVRATLRECCAAEHLFDPQMLGADALRSALLTHFKDRHAHRAGVAVTIAALRRRVRCQQTALVDAITTIANAGPGNATRAAGISQQPPAAD